MPKIFTKTVNIYQRDNTGARVLVDQQPVVERELGAFTFRAPTFREQKDISVRIDRDLCVFEDPQRVGIETFYRVMVCAHFPYQVVAAPGEEDRPFNWDELTYEEGRAIYDAYVEGVEETGTKNSNQ